MPIPVTKIYKIFEITTNNTNNVINIRTKKLNPQSTKGKSFKLE